jgi:hypothetical protein
MRLRSALMYRRLPRLCHSPIRNPIWRSHWLIWLPQRGSHRRTRHLCPLQAQRRSIQSRWPAIRSALACDRFPCRGPQLADHSGCDAAPLPHPLWPRLHPAIQPSSSLVLASEALFHPPGPAPPAPSSLFASPAHHPSFSRLPLPPFVVRPRVVAVVARHNFCLDNHSFPLSPHSAFSRPTAQIAIKKGSKREASGRLATKSF